MVKYRHIVRIEDLGAWAYTDSGHIIKGHLRTHSRVPIDLSLLPRKSSNGAICASVHGYVARLRPGSDSSSIVAATLTGAKPFVSSLKLWYPFTRGRVKVRFR